MEAKIDRTRPMQATALQASTSAPPLASKSSCAAPIVIGGTHNVVGSLSLHDIFIIVCAITTGFACLISLTLAALHLKYYKRPKEQRLIVRIILFPVFYSLCSLFGAIFYQASDYLQAVPRFFEAIAIVSLFQLFLQYVAPGKDAERDAVLEQLSAKGHVSRDGQPAKASIKWFRGIWVCVFQLLYAMIATLVATEATLAYECPRSPKGRESQLIIRGVALVSVVTAAIAIIAFEWRLKVELKPHKPLLKIVALKSLVFIGIVQNYILTRLRTLQTPQPTSTASSDDLSKGLQNLLVSCETFLFSLLFFWVFSASPYKHATPVAHLASGSLEENIERRPHVGRAILDIVNISDIVKGGVSVAKIALELIQISSGSAGGSGGSGGGN